MADTKISAYTELTAPAANDFLEIVDVSDTTFAPEGTNRKVQLLNLLLLPGINGGRLTLEAGVPASTADQTAKSSVYWTPHEHGLIALPVASTGPWRVVSQVETSISLSGLTTGKNYDVFGYLNTGALSLELSAAWTSDTARTDALGTLDGRLVKNANKTRLYLGTFRTTGTTTTEDSATKRFVWNAYNRVRRRLRRIETRGGSWTYSSSTIRQANGSTANQVEVVVGLDGVSDIDLFLAVTSSPGTATTVGHIGFGEDSTTVGTNDHVAVYPAFTSTAGIIAGSFCRLEKTVSLGYHYYPWLECSAANGATVTFYGGNTANMLDSGIQGGIHA